jgi:hypothetical protein
MSFAGRQQFAGLRRGGEATVAERLALLRGHRQPLTGRIQQLQASGAALAEKISYYQSIRRTHEPRRAV